MDVTQTALDRILRSGEQAQSCSLQSGTSLRHRVTRLPLCDTHLPANRSQAKANWHSITRFRALAAMFLMLAPSAIVAQVARVSLPANYPADQDVVRHQEISPELQGDLLMVRKRYLAAIEAYSQAPQDSAVVWNKVGIANHHLLKLAEAKRDYERALSLNPNYAEAMNNLGTVYYSDKSYRQAERYYKKALKLAPQSATTYSNLGTAYFAEKKYKKGAASYQKAFELDPNVFISDSTERIEGGAATEDRASLNFCLAETFAQAGMNDRALEYLRHAFDEGFKDRKKLMEDKELVTLRSTPQFQELLAQEHIH